MPNFNFDVPQSTIPFSAYLNPSPLARALPQIQQAGQGIGDAAGEFIKRRRKIAQVQQFRKQFPEYAALATPENIDQIALHVAEQKAKAPKALAKPVTSIWQDPTSNEISAVPKEGWLERHISEAQATQQLLGQTSQKARTSAMEGRNAQWGRSIDAKQADTALRLGSPGTAIVKTLGENNRRFISATAILDRQGGMTWQNVDQVVSDMSAVLHGGVSDIQTHANQAYPNIMQKFAAWKTYATASPTKNVPPEIANELRALVTDLKGVNDNLIKNNADTVADVLGPTMSKSGAVTKALKRGNQFFMQGKPAGQEQKKDSLGIR